MRGSETRTEHWIGPAALALAPCVGAGLGWMASRGLDPLALAFVGAPFALLVRLPPYAWVAASLGAVTIGRLAGALGGAASLNFAHYPLTLLAVATALTLGGGGTRLSRRLIAGCTALLAIALASAFANDVVPISALMVWLVFAEPFLLLFALTHRPPQGREATLFGHILLGLILVQVPIAAAQAAAYGVGDRVQGTFIGQGAGAHVLGAMVLAGAALAVHAGYARTRTARAGLIGAALVVNVLADAKQVIGIFVVALALMGLRNSPRYWPRYALGLLAVLGVLSFSARYNGAIAQLMDRGLIENGALNKLRVVPLIVARFDSPADWLLGVGPGNTVSRVALMAHSGYRRGGTSLSEVGLGTSATTEQIWEESQASDLSVSGRGSSAWSLIFSWCGVWGDLGALGLLCLIALGWAVWREAVALAPAAANAARFVVLCVALLGFVYSYLEEPGLTLVVGAWIGLLHARARVPDARERTAAGPAPVADAVMAAGPAVSAAR